MYLSHFGLNESPFRITPHIDFFFAGANRGATLEALLYAITHDEGIVKVSGEVGSGKTMLCRVLMERLPEHVDTILLSNPSLSREEILHAIADDLKLELGAERRNMLLRVLQDHLIALYARNRRVVVLIDEAHAMPQETLEQIRLLSNLETSRSKLLQIVLFGQPELDAHLGMPHMRQLKERITHSFRLEPLVRSDIEEYIEFRMRAAGYKGPNVFTPAAVRQIVKASEGLTRRINILADKSLLAAFADNTHTITAKHALRAVRDSEFFKPGPSGAKIALAAGGVAAGLALGLGAHFLLVPETPPAAPVRPAPIVAAPVQAAPASAPAGSADPAAPAPTNAAEKAVGPAAPVAAPQAGTPTPTSAVIQGAPATIAPVAAPALPVAPVTPVAPVATTATATTAATAATVATMPVQASTPQAQTKTSAGQASRAAPAPAVASVPPQPKAAPKSAVPPALPGLATSPAPADAAVPAPPQVAAVAAVATPNSPAVPAQASRAAPANAASLAQSLPAQQPVLASSAKTAPPAPTGKGPQPPANATAATASAEESLILTSANARPGSKNHVPPAPPSGKLTRERFAATQAWLKTAPGDHYSLQLLTADGRDIRRIEELLARAPARQFDLADFHVYAVRINDRQHYRVAYGLYASLTEVNQAIRALPQAYRQLGPYHRSVQRMRSQNRQ